MIKKIVIAVVALGLLIGFGNMTIAGSGCGFKKSASCGAKADNAQKAEAKMGAACGEHCKDAAKACDNCKGKAMKANAGKDDKAMACADCQKADAKMCASCETKMKAQKKAATMKSS